MSDAVADAVPRRSGLEAWLRFDADQIPAVEAAYDSFIRACRPGVNGIVALCVGFIAAVAISHFVFLYSHVAALPIALAGGMLAAYAFFGYSCLRCPPDVLFVVLRGCVDANRACLFAALVMVPISLVELVLYSWLNGSIPMDRFVHPIAVAVALTNVTAIVIGPIGEEFFFQGWLQTRLRGLESFWPAAATTALFLLFHGPRRSSEYLRVLGLGFNAYLRASTRSLAACVVAHVVNNAMIVSFMTIYSIARYGSH